MTEPTTLSSAANVDTTHASDVIRQAYRQVFGNRHLMELDVNASIEALFMNGDLTVQGLVTALAQSETYKKLFLETNSPYRFVELNFKHLLGRPPRDQAELMSHVPSSKKKDMKQRSLVTPIAMNILRPLASTKSLTTGPHRASLAEARSFSHGQELWMPVMPDTTTRKQIQNS